MHKNKEKMKQERNCDNNDEKLFSYIQSLRLYNSFVLIYFFIIIIQVAFQYLLMRWNCCYLKRHFIQGLGLAKKQEERRIKITTIQQRQLI